jgi:predicted metalloprotease with PDZ domain
MHSMPLLLSLSCALLPMTLAAQRPAAPASRTQAPIEYVLRFPAPETHYVEVSAAVPAEGRRAVELMMAVWTPGSYLVREFSRHVEELRARTHDGTPLSVEKTTKNRWRVVTGGAPLIVVTYRVYGREMTVRTNFISSAFALINGAPTFITDADGLSRPHDVRLELPAGWKGSRTALPPSPSGTAHRYRAPDFDTLVDSPIVAGSPAVYEFTVAGRSHVLANVNEGGIWDGSRSARDSETIVAAHAKFWGRVPYDRYVILNLITEAGGGLEHSNSTVLMTSRWRARTRRGYVSWLELVSHELFHAWNGKRLRPAELGPFDYERENYTPSLWIAEGFTEYYGDLLVRRAGLSTDAEYFDRLSTGIEELQGAPGRLVQPLGQASFDAWVKYYRPDENTPNSSVSYYTKGAIVAFLLDMEIRRATRGARTLDDLMRAAYAKYAGSRGYTQEEFRRLATEVAGVDLAPWFAKAVDSTEDLDYSAAFAWLGLRFRVDVPQPDQPQKAWLGAKTRTDGGRLIVTEVRRGTPAAQAGVNVDDEIIAIGDYRVRPDHWDARMEAYGPGQRVSLLVARREQLLRLEVTLGAEPRRSWRLEPDPGATPGQQQRLQAWLTGS